MTVSRISEFGLYLKEIDGQAEVLLPKRYVTDEMTEGSKVRVFVYRDSEDRPVATTEVPFARVGQFAFLQTVQVNRVGAFMDWGLPKNLLVPFKEQKIKMFPGGIYLVYVYLDNNTGRVVASARIEKFLDNVIPAYKRGDKVEALIIGHNDIGYQCIVDNLHRGMVFNNDVFAPLEIGNTVPAYVKNVREEDNKIDLSLTATDTGVRVDELSERIIERLKDGSLTVSDKSAPQAIKEQLECSKKDFKKAVGKLYKEHRITIDSDGTIKLNEINR